MLKGCACGLADSSKCKRSAPGKSTSIAEAVNKIPYVLEALECLPVTWDETNERITWLIAAVAFLGVAIIYAAQK